MSSLNKVLLIGNLGADPTLRYTQGGSSVSNFSLATHEVRTDKEGVRSKQTEWHRVVSFGKLADLCQAHLKKGRKVYVEGRLRTRSYTKEPDHVRYVTEVIAERIRFLGGRNAAATSPGTPSPEGPEEMEDSRL
jgi:single-strand DNA-binding protein